MILLHNQSMHKDCTLFARNKSTILIPQVAHADLWNINKLSKYIFYNSSPKNAFENYTVIAAEKKSSPTCVCSRGNLFCIKQRQKVLQSICILVKPHFVYTHFAMMTTFTAVSDRSLWRKSLKNVSTLCIVIYPQRMICLELSQQHS